MGHWPIAAQCNDYGNINLFIIGSYDVWRYQTITLTNNDFLWGRFCDVHLRTISQAIIPHNEFES